MNRETGGLDQEWDFLIIGGGATGLGAAVDAASRGLKVLLVEQNDFAKATSSRSTKLIHGGLRYLQQGNIALVLEALRERGRLCQNATHLIYHRAFFVPSYHWWQGPFYGIGLKIYDLLAGKLGIEPSKHLSKKETIEALPTLETEGLYGGTLYYDGQFDDSRLAITLAQTATDHGAHLINYMKVTSLVKKNDHVEGAILRDEETGDTHEVRARVVINATGIFSDEVRHMDEPQAPTIVRPSQGIHVVLDKSFLDSETAILVPHTADGRVLFVVPWLGKVLAGTTDTPVKKPEMEPKPLEEEIDFVLKETGKYLTKHPKREDILSVFAGHRPLIAEQGTEKTAAISRDHSILVSKSGLITIAGGKWTTYRKMAEDVVDKALQLGGFDEIPCKTKTLKLHGWMEGADPLDPWSTYGTDRAKIETLIEEDPTLGELFDPKLPYLKGEVVWAVREEMARTVEDVLSRRTRSLLLDASLAMKVAPMVAALMAKELGKGKEWEESQVAAFTKLAQNYVMPTKG
ncbi:glycerol-3-phosphate dehydrogenase/oxidase [Candidatus Neptunochlamydia vexilliferae]|uniref:glycerol-3-phosphate dehydrogenase/oxidase n=1 Tax=Candidatus Neptunichlamydia vexilliferae TaxID=1651774 RepID=UPI0018919D0F|nr:glycerol-3-phosphate dehydrogenase/oxidase [Candidatus Neptunochlamydia vexilliferae]